MPQALIGCWSPSVGDDIIVDVRTHQSLDDYVYLPQEVYGITPQVKKQAKSVFKEADADGSGTIDADEMYQLVQILFKRCTKGGNDRKCCATRQP